MSAFLNSHLELSLSIVTVALGLLFWFLVLLWARPRNGHGFQSKIVLKKPHYIQTALALGLYVYWGLYWVDVRDHVPLVIVQLVFAYLFEMLLSWSRGKVWHVGFGPFPVVLSINFFLWFREDYFYLQFLLLALTYLTKEFVTWERNGRRTHMFNPSAISLALVSIVLMTTDSISLTKGVDLTLSFSLPPSFFEAVFLLGLVTQFLFGTTLVTFGAAAAMTTIYVVSGFVLGTTITPTPIDVVVFLGLTFLVTDPSTSPRSNTGKFLFGLTYGTCVVIAYMILLYYRQPSYFDKILVVPVVNLLVKLFDVGALRLENSNLVRNLNQMKWMPPAGYARVAYLGVYIGFFLAIVPSLKAPAGDFVGPLPKPSTPPSPAMAGLRARHVACSQIYPQVYRPFGFAAEFSHYARLTGFEPKTAMEHDKLGDALRDLGDVENAIMHLEEALVLDPGYAPAHLHLGIALMEQNRLDEAIPHIRRSLEVNPDDALAHVSLGTAHAMLGSLDDAVSHLQRAVEIDPDQFKGHLNLGGAFLNLGRLNEAIDHLRRALEIRPYSGAAHRNLGIALSQEGQLEDAIVHMRQALVVMPDDREGHSFLASLEAASAGRSRTQLNVP